MWDNCIDLDIDLKLQPVMDKSESDKAADIGSIVSKIPGSSDEPLQKTAQCNADRGLTLRIAGSWLDQSSQSSMPRKPLPQTHTLQGST